jgi:pyruvate,water dikinase
MRFARSRLFGIARRLFGRLADLFAAQGMLDCREDFYYLTVSEVFGYLQGTSATQDLRRLVDLRREEYARFESLTLPDRLHTTGAPYPVPTASEAALESGNGSLWGTGCSSGTVHGAAWVVSDPRAADRAGNYVLVAECTDPGWAFLMIRARGLVVERGSVLSHTAIIGRELGIPTVVGVRSATARIKDGSPISINGSTGEVRCE